VFTQPSHRVVARTTAASESPPPTKGIGSVGDGFIWQAGTS